MSQDTYETFMLLYKQVFKAYKKKPYDELMKLPAVIPIPIENLGFPKHTVARLRKKLDRKSGELDFNLKVDLRITKTEYEARYETSKQADLEEARKSMTEKQFKEYAAAINMIKPKVCEDNPTLVEHYGWNKDFTIRPDGKAQEDDFTLSLNAEKKTKEKAPWIGKTGLGVSAERELPRYLRLEFGEFILDDDSLKAEDMEYLGRFELTAADDVNEGTFDDGTLAVYCWRVPTSGKAPLYGYIEEGGDGSLRYSMGDTLPAQAVDMGLDNKRVVRKRKG